MGRRLTFNRWLTSVQQIGRLDAIGTRARDVLHDGCWPRPARATVEELQQHMEGHEAPAEAVTALHEAHGEWQ